MNFETLFNEIELLFAQKSLDILPNLIPTITKIMVTKEIWDELEKERIFKVCIQRKPIYRYIDKRVNKKQWEKQWVKVIPEPNLGGIPLELSDKIDIIVEGKPPVKRKSRKDIYSETYSNQINAKQEA